MNLNTNTRFNMKIVVLEILFNAKNVKKSSFLINSNFIDLSQGLFVNKLLMNI